MEGGSPDQESIASGTKRSSISSGGRSSRNHKEFLHRFVDSEIFIDKLDDWFESISHQSPSKKPSFDVPFESIELQKFDYALEGVSFQQLIRMPSAVYASTSTSDAVEATAYLAIEDFLHASVKGLWEAFWSQDGPLPFSIGCLYDANMKFYQAEKAIANGKLGGLCATGVLLKNSRHPHGKWDHILELALLRPNIGSDGQNSLSVIGEAIFFALRLLLSRKVSRLNVLQNSDSVFVLIVDSQYGGVVKVEGDVNKLGFDANNVYDSAARWVRKHSRVSVSSIDRVWNKLGNTNWGDLGALQLLFATFNCITQFAGLPKYSVEDLAADHGTRLQSRRIERQLEESSVNGNGNGLYRLQQRSASPEIVEVQEESESIRVKSEDTMKLQVGSVLWLEDSNWQKGYQINEVLNDGELKYYIASFIEDPKIDLFLYVGSHPSQLEPAWEDMNLWYQVQRQTKILTIMKQKGLSSKYLPQLSASGRIIHPGQCQRPSSGGNCGHPWCGTPILVTNPVGETVSSMVNNGRFGVEEAIRCCHDCLSALSAAASAGIRHGDISPANVICVRSGTGTRHPYFVLIGWGHAILEERDRPAMNLHFSSTYALQDGKLCSASDAESLVYLLYFVSGGEMPDLDSVEGALQWRENSWSRRLIQQKLGDISAVLKAFADYVDSLCGTPYPMDYDIWLRRLKRHIHDDDHGKEVDASG